MIKDSQIQNKPTMYPQNKQGANAAIKEVDCDKNVFYFCCTKS